MAYMNQEKKSTIAAALKMVVPKGWKYSLSVDNHSTIVLTIKSAPVDLMAEIFKVGNSKAYTERDKFSAVPTEHGVNPYYLDRQFDTHLEVFENIKKAMYSAGWYNNSDAMTDYFDIAYYINIKLGRWNQPFVVKG